MKNYKLSIGAGILTAFVFTACSGDVLTPQDAVYENDETRFVQIDISNPPSTRAGASFEDGTSAENIVQHAYFIFYDEYGNVVGNNSIVGMEFQDNPAGNNQSVGKIATTTVRLSIPKGSNIPKYVMAFLNPVSYEEIEKQINMNQLRSSIREDYLCTHGNFAMNNSAYYGVNPITGANNVKLLGAPLDETQLHLTEDGAKNSAKPIDIYVERYAAKVRLTLKTQDAVTDVLGQTIGIEDQKIGKDGKEYRLRFVPEAWSINADAPEMYASKRFENSNSADHLVPSYADVQAMLGNWTSWNDSDRHRSYWACSPGYYATEFPTVSDEIIDIAGAGKTGAGEKVGDFELRYYSYNQIVDQSADNKSEGKGITVFNDGATNWKYVLENTMGQDAFRCSNPKAAAPSVVIVGEYVVYKGDTKIDNPAGFCLYSDDLYFMDVPRGMEGVKTIKDVLMDLNGILATDATGTLMTSAASSKIHDCLEVAHPSAAVRGNQKLPHRYVTLQLKQNLTAEDLTGLYYKPGGSDSWIPITNTLDKTLEEVIDGINKLLWAQIGNAQIYNKNKAYFSIPIEHLGMTENPWNQANPPKAEDGSINWKNVRVGDFGLVRNHVYKLEVTAIKGLASGIDGLDNPLVPSMEEDEYWVKYKINILNWRVVPTQSGIVLK